LWTVPGRCWDFASHLKRPGFDPLLLRQTPAALFQFMLFSLAANEGFPGYYRHIIALFFKQPGAGKFSVADAWLKKLSAAEEGFRNKMLILLS
jgi:hypothetical protein